MLGFLLIGQKTYVTQKNQNLTPCWLTLRSFETSTTIYQSATS